MNSKKNNYIEMRNQMRTYFLSYDQEEMIRKFDLAYDEEYLYIRFWNRPYRIGRTTGIVEWSEDQFHTCSEGDYNESLTIYDVLCYSEPGCRLSGEYAPSNSLKGTVYTGMVAGSSMGERKTEAFFDANADLLSRACEALGGVPEGQGDVAYRLPMFDFLPVRFAFWHSDEDFLPEIRFLWDTNVLNFMHYETLWMGAGHLLHRLQNWMQNNQFENKE